MASSKVKRAIAAFEKAVKDRELVNTERFQRLSRNEAQETRILLAHNYVKARAKLERLMENV